MNSTVPLNFIFILDGEEGSGRSGKEGQSSDGEGQPVHQTAA